MLYLISGCSRAGKTLLAKRLLKQTGITYLSLDWIVMGFTNGMPQCGIHDKLFPHEIAERISDFFDSMCESMLWIEEDVVIEGEAIMPGSARALIDRHPDHVKACFLGYVDADAYKKFEQIKQHSAGDRDWLTKESDGYIRDHIENMIQHSRMVKRQCEQHDINYVDTSHDFVAALDEAYIYLTAN